MRFFLVCCLFFSAFAVFAQAGALDSAFGANGLKQVQPQPVLNKANVVLEQADHKILLAGYDLSGANNAFLLARLLPDGTTDSTFGINGIVETLPGSGGQCSAGVLQSDGKIVLVGKATSSGSSSTDMAIVRYTADGKPDSTFSGDGIQFVSFGSGDDAARAVAVDGSGNLVLAGTTLTSSGSLMAVARLKPNGLLDGTFSGDGKVTLGIGTFFTNGYAMALDANGAIVVTGAAKFGMEDDVALARFLPNGNPDPALNNSGYTTLNLGSANDSGNAVAIQPDGKIVVTGITGASRDFAVIRFMANGAPDNTFGNQGWLQTDFAGSDDYANAVAVQPDGKILAGGYAYTGALPDFALARYLTDGTPDAAFGTSGKVTTDFGNSYDYGFPMTLQADGKILLGGYVFGAGHTDMAVARYISGLAVGVVDFEQPTALLLAPNPIQDQAELTFETTADGLYSLALVDMHGRLVQPFFTGKYLPAGKQIEQLAFLPGIARGYYFLQLSNGARTLAIKVIK